jgi:hypothetical protein
VKPPVEAPTSSAVPCGVSPKLSSAWISFSAARETQGLGSGDHRHLRVIGHRLRRFAGRHAVHRDGPGLDQRLGTGTAFRQAQIDETLVKAHRLASCTMPRPRRIASRASVSRSSRPIPSAVATFSTMLIRSGPASAPALLWMILVRRRTASSEVLHWPAI